MAASLALGIAGEQCRAGADDCASGASISVAGETQAALGSITAGDVACGRELSQSVTECPVHPGSQWLELVRAWDALWCTTGSAWLLSGCCSTGGMATATTHGGLCVLLKGEMCVGCFTSPGLSLMSAAARARAVLSLGWSFSSLQPTSSPGCSCPSLLTCFKSFPALMLRC